MAYIDIQQIEDYLKINADILFKSDFEIKEFLNKLYSIPIADVVPRSEVEKAKQKVAKQIFEEIENIIARNTQHGFKGKYKVHCITGFNGRQITRLIAELKKKYIGDNNG